MNKDDSKYRNIQIAVILYLQSLYDDSVDKVLSGLSLSDLSDKELFSFKNYPQLSQQADKVINGLTETLLAYINSQITSVWNLSNSKNDTLVDNWFARIKEEPKISFKSHNEKQLDQFLNRKVKNLTISDRVWNLNGSFKSEIESAVSAAIEKGQSAKQLARDIKKYLNNPDARFRRIRDKYGNLKPSKSALSYNPGQGVYRSAHANALRLARQEINQAYRESDHIRWSQNPGVIGYRIQNSNREATICPICKQFNGIVFPKSHKFGGFHIQCMCTAIPILVSDEEFNKILNDKNYQPKQPGMPKEYIESEYIQKTKNEAGLFDSTSKEIAQKVGINVTDVNIKSTKRIFEKANTDYNGDVTKVRDIIRNTFVANESKHESIISEISKNFEIDRIKYQKSTSDPLGYSGILMNVKLKNGTFAEIQVNSASMLYGKDLESKSFIGKDAFEKIRTISGLEPGLGHKYYEEWRTLNKDIISQRRRMEEIESLSRSYYEKLRKVGL